MKKTAKWFSMFLAFCMLLAAVQFTAVAANVQVASDATLHRFTLTGDESYAEADIANGSKYISVPPTASFQSMAFELFQPLRGTGASGEAFAPKNEIDFDVIVKEKPGADNAYISFAPKERVVTGDGTRPWSIMISNDGFYYVRNNGEYVKTEATYEVGKPNWIDVVFNFEDHTYTVMIDNVVAAENFALSGESTKDIDGRNFGTEADNVGIIAVVSPKIGQFELRNISAGITNLVDDDSTKNLGETNPVFNADGTKTYRVGPTHVFQKVQDVILMVRPGDVVEIEGDQEYPAPLHFVAANGMVEGTVEQPITFKGISVNGKRPVIRSAGAVNVVDMGASNITLDNLDITGHLYRAMAVRGFTDPKAFAEAYPGRGDSENKLSFRGVFLSDGENHVIRNCVVHGNYHGIQASHRIGNVTIEYSDIYLNGSDPYGHNIYLDSKLDAVMKIRYNYIHDTILKTNNGYKSRAWRNEVHYNYFYNLAQAMELIGPSDRTETPRDGEIVGNLIVDCSQGMRVGGDGVGSGTRGRYRIVNNTYANINAGESFFLRTFTQLESVELYNNIVYSVDTLRFWSPIDSQWISDVRIFGRNNWFSLPLEVEKFPYQMTKQTLGEGDPFMDSAAGDFRINPNSEAGQSVLAMEGSPAGTVEAWPLVEGRTSPTFENPLTVLSSQPIDPMTGEISARPAEAKITIGAFASDAVVVPAWVSPYVDVNAADAFYDAVAFVTENKLFGGIGNSMFGPQMGMSRAMFVTVLYNMAGAPEVDAAVAIDIPAGAYYKNAAMWAFANGYYTVAGAVNEIVTGAEASKVLAVYAKTNEYAFEDVDAFTALYADADATMTRADAAQLFKDFVELVLQ